LKERKEKTRSAKKRVGARHYTTKTPLAEHDQGQKKSIMVNPATAQSSEKTVWVMREPGNAGGESSQKNQRGEKRGEPPTRLRNPIGKRGPFTKIGYLDDSR